MGNAWPALDIHVPGCDPQLRDLIFAELDDFQPTAIQETDDASPLRAFFGSAGARESARLALAAAFGIHIFVTAIDVDDEDWAARSQARLRAVTVGRLTIAPPWDAAVTATASEPGGVTAPKTVIVIRPSMGFGTGHHATTRLALSALQTVEVQGADVLDVGCGSGVLAIASVQLGAGSALGIDIDPDALSSANDNLALNDTSGRVRFEALDFRELPPASNLVRASNIVLANLTGGLLERSARQLAELVAPDGWLIVSGFMEGETEVVPALERFCSLHAIEQEDEWLCAVLRSKPPPL